ncbi:MULTISPECIES: cytochrome c oxidase subunit II [Planktothrix]|uniref:Cytochrome c oxidase subunit 2 n=5 Tax=Planktothrix TaxID=54304 RepID=A0A1J1JB28_PLAAG|nr:MULTISPECIES: cytochrome c oxidase subunit II [Planktothrix]MCB8782522.1 cytochrome c oxidase subunit II [Planktothrix agardhii 1808]MBG0747530.1 cytochrome c oxidase subunit II [Planktothrix agardhii KL2]MCB8759774.1 cytochrome c oxidase subunit II [Planktothrix agardhii 1813]MCB8764463.1 cytochrome c oxidase subunit II [Planktothrix agardhii 1809]MCB8766145.1 cytochrome c oxidase subunit II [Planktothrix agardhii 1809]
MKIPSSILTLLVGIGITLVSLWYGQNHNLLPVAATEQAAQVDGLFDIMMTISFGLVLLVEGVLVVAAIKFRRRPDDNTDAAPIHGNIPLEIVWTAIPAVVVLGIGIYSFEIYNNMGGLDPMASGQHSMHAHGKMNGAAIAAPLIDGQPPQAPRERGVGGKPELTQIALGIGASPSQEGKAAAVNVDVTGLQFAWLFNYKETGINAGELHVPIGQEVQLNMSAQDVIHAFWIPQLRLKQDTIPGRITELRFTPNKLGTYPIVCAELCGSYHGAMRSQMIVDTPEDYQAWVAENLVASNPDLQTAVAINPAELSEGEFLAPYANENQLSVNSEQLSVMRQLTVASSQQNLDFVSNTDY